MKAAKQVIYNNISPDGSLHNHQATQGILQYQNTLLPNINLSLAQVLLHCQLRNSIPAHPAHYCPQKECVLTAEEREKRLSKCNHILIQKHDAKAHELGLIPLTLGTHVVVEVKDKKCDRTRCIVEVLLNKQYRIRMLHSGRVILRHHGLLREYTAIIPEVYQPIPSATLLGSTPPAATDCDTPDATVGPQQMNIDPEKHLEELPMAPTGNVPAAKSLNHHRGHQASSQSIN